MIIISRFELIDNGYSHIVSQDDDYVIICNFDGVHEHFAIRKSFSGWCLEAEDGRVLEFCFSQESE